MQRGGRHALSLLTEEVSPFSIRTSTLSCNLSLNNSRGEPCLAHAAECVSNFFGKRADSREWLAPANPRTVCGRGSAERCHGAALTLMVHFGAGAEVIDTVVVSLSVRVRWKITDEIPRVAGHAAFRARLALMPPAAQQGCRFGKRGSWTDIGFGSHWNYV